MSAIRVLVGTKKGAFILTADGSRQYDWKVVSGPHFAGWGNLSPQGALAADLQTASTPRNPPAGLDKSSNARMTAA